jgi:hypothetical protein
MGRRLKAEMDEEAAVAGHVLRSRRMLADMFEQGSGILAGMAGSRERIKVRPAARAAAGRGRGTPRRGVAARASEASRAPPTQAPTPRPPTSTPPDAPPPPTPQKAQKKMLDVINSVGLGDSVLRMIERRHKTDAYIALGGMVGGPGGGGGGVGWGGQGGWLGALWAARGRGRSWRRRRRESCAR